MILAVLETRCGVRIGANDIYLNVAGGLKVNEPAADLAVAAALISSLTGTPLPADAVLFRRNQPVGRRAAGVACGAAAARSGQARLRPGLYGKAQRQGAGNRSRNRGIQRTVGAGRPRRGRPADVAVTRTLVMIRHNPRAALGFMAQSG